MPKFHFNLRGGDQVGKDQLGTELPSLAEAKEMAMALLNNAREASAASQYPIDAVVITDDSGRELAVMDRQAKAADRGAMDVK